MRSDESTSAQRLEAGLIELGISQPRRVAAWLLTYSRLLLEANRQTNLVGAKSLDGLIAPHLLDSLAPLSGLRLAEPVVDLGSGAGLPGIPAAIAWPSMRIILLEPRAKRALFLENAVAHLALRNVTVVQKTAQAAVRSGQAGRAGTVLVRALAAPDKTLTVALSLLRPGGMAIAYQGTAAAPTTSQLRTLAKAGGSLVEARRVRVPYLHRQRHAWLVEKMST